MFYCSKLVSQHSFQQSIIRKDMQIASSLKITRWGWGQCGGDGVGTGTKYSTVSSSSLNPSSFHVICRIRPTCPMVTDLAELPKMCTVKQQIGLSV